MSAGDFPVGLETPAPFNQSYLVTKDDCFHTQTKFIEEISGVKKDIQYLKGDVQEIKIEQKDMRKEIKNEFDDVRKLLIDAQVKKRIREVLFALWGKVPQTTKLIIYILIALGVSSGLISAVVSALRM